MEPDLDKTERMFSYCVDKLQYKFEKRAVTAYDGDVIEKVEQSVKRYLVSHPLLFRRVASNRLFRMPEDHVSLRSDRAYSVQGDISCRILSRMSVKRPI